MADFRQCEFFLLRYVPDVVKGEFVNLGVVLLEEGENGFTDVRFLRDWRRVRGLDPAADIELLESYESELRRALQSQVPEAINYRGPMSRRDWLLAQMRESFSGALEITPMTAVLTESPQAEIGKLAQMYLESSRRVQRQQSGRAVIYNAMRDAFEKAGVWESRAMRKDIAVAQYTRKGDPLTIDCGYRPNGVIHLFHAVSLATDVNSAKVLAYSYSEMREGLHAAEHAVSDLTAITEDGLDLTEEGVAFALATLESSAIAVAKMSEMPQIAERARFELKL
ncbi:MAG TPA: DUF3037 domain-containing protein [Candidatus Bathyarchaeia archaeon]|nr:DUF3037 domain-containing protein [Candidatus Bathyarchaeia archaeon]